MIQVCFVLDLRSLAPPLLRDLKQSLLQLANFYAISNSSSSHARKSATLADKIDKCVSVDGVAFRESSNGVFVNGVEIKKGMAAELSIGDKVSLVCGNEDDSCCVQDRKIGFVVQRIDVDFDFDINDVEMNNLILSGHSQGKRNKRVFAVSRYERIGGRANFLLHRCHEILLSDDPISCVMSAVSDILCADSEVQSKLPLMVKNSTLMDKSNGAVQSSSCAPIF